MKKIILCFLFMQSLVFAQELKLMKATMQTINHGASPTSTTNYIIQLNKEKTFAWSIDSIHSMLGTSIKYNIVKVDNPDAVSPQYKQVKTFSKKDKGIYQLTFGSTKQNGSGRQVAPQQIKVNTENFSNGVIIYYSVKKKKINMKIESFEELESINAP